jgi:hypothetical protein
MSCTGNSLMCVTVVTYGAAVRFIYWVLSWERHVIRAKAYGTLIWRHFTAGGQCYCSLNGVCYSEHYLEDNSQQVDSSIAAWMEWVTVNIIWKIFHTDGQFYCSLNVVCYSEHYLEDNSQQVDSGTVAWMECVTVNIIWKLFHTDGQFYCSLN